MLLDSATTQIPHKPHSKSIPFCRAQIPLIQRLPLTLHPSSVFCLYDLNIADISSQIRPQALCVCFLMLACMQVHACVHILKTPSTSCFDTGSPGLELFNQTRLVGQQTPCLFLSSSSQCWRRQPSHLDFFFLSVFWECSIEGYLSLFIFLQQTYLPHTVF